MAQKKLNHHEDIQVAPGNYLVRQDRFRTDGSMRVESSVGHFLIKNYSSFGLAASSEVELEMDQIIGEAQLFVNDQMIIDFSLAVRRKERVGVSWEYGLETLTGAVPVEQIQILSELTNAVSLVKEKEQSAGALSVEFRCLVQELASRMKSFEQLAQSFELKPYMNKAEREMAIELLINTLSKEIFNDIKTTNLKLQKLTEFQGEDVLKKGFGYFREVVGHYIYQSPFTKRSFEKPRGYAGDFEMMNQVYRNDGHAMSVFGSCMEKAVHFHEEPSAVRNRSKYLSDKIISKVNSTEHDEVNILSVACGPAEEVKIAIQTLSQDKLDRTSFWLLDQDEDALKFAQKNIKTMALKLGKKVKVQLVRKSIKEIILEGIHDHAYDLIYSAGLFDYFSDPVAMRAAKALAAATTSKGTLVIGNFNITSPNWFGMLSLFDWHLILRGEGDLTRIFSVPGFRMRVEAEEENVNLFCVMDRANN